MVFNLPNLFSAFRVFLTPFVAFAILHRHFGMALALIGIAGVSDALDGYIARKLGKSSRLGEYLDPIADKILLVTVYLCEGLAGLLPPWLVALVFGRDLLILGIVAWGMVFTRIRSFPPSIWGKLSTAAQIAAALAVLADRDDRLDRGWVLAPVAVTAVWSGLYYCWSGIQQLRTGNVWRRTGE